MSGPGTLKYFTISLITVLILALGCSKNIIPEIIFSEPSMHNMKFLPSNPSLSDEIKLVIYDDCKYNNLAGVIQNGHTIYIVKQYNSRMMLPCMITNDTIKIGILPAGSYIINYKLLDIAPKPSATTINLNFSLIVQK